MHSTMREKEKGGLAALEGKPERIKQNKKAVAP